MRKLLTAFIILLGGLSIAATYSITLQPGDSATVTAATLPAALPTAACPTNALINAQNPVNYGADPSGVANSAGAFAAALAVGDLDVPAGTFLISTSVTVPNPRGIKCEPGAVLKRTDLTSWAMFMFNNNSAGGMWGCHFRGPNYNVSPPGYVGVGQEFIFHQSTDTSGVAGNLLFTNNDFNGINGYTGAVMVYANSANQPPPHGDTIACNTAENCGYNWLQLTSARNTSVRYNTTLDCSGDVEADNTSQQNTGNVIDHDDMTFTAGVGYANHGGGQSGNWNHLTGGVSASGAAFNYHGNTVSNSICHGTQASWLYESAVGGPQNNAIYTNDTVSGACVVH